MNLGRRTDLEFIANLHEQGAAIAAEAYSKVTNELGVVLVMTGPGGTNAVTGVASAWLDSMPVLVLSGQVKRADLKRDQACAFSAFRKSTSCRLFDPSPTCGDDRRSADDPGSLEEAVYTAQAVAVVPCGSTFPSTFKLLKSIRPSCAASLHPRTRCRGAADAGPGTAGTVAGIRASVIVAGNGIRAPGRSRSPPSDRDAADSVLNGGSGWTCSARPIISTQDVPVRLPPGGQLRAPNSDLMLVVGAWPIWR